MRYAIVVNPASGKTTKDEKRASLAEPAAILDAEIHGLDTATAGELRQCVQGLSERYDVLVIAGGDGTFHDVINAVDTVRTPVAFLPLGTGNALRHALGYRGTLASVAMRIKEGPIREYDLIHCDEKSRAFMAAIGLDGAVAERFHHYRRKGAAGVKAYFRAVCDGYSRTYTGFGGRIMVDGTMLEMKKLLSLMVVKAPYYGFGMKVAPKARFDDGNLHILCVNAGLLRSFMGALTAFTIGNRVGKYVRGRQLRASFDRPVPLQVDGNRGWTSHTFHFRILPRSLRIKC
jgi:diacylglycerol kinase family enzyme